MNLNIATVLASTYIGTIGTCFAVDNAVTDLTLKYGWRILFKVLWVEFFENILYGRFIHETPP